MLAALIAAGRAAGTQLPRLAAWVEGLGVWGPLVYVASYVVATVAFVPGALPTIAAGALFGLGAGTVYAFLGETLGGAAAFFIARRLARPLVERRLAGNRRFDAIERAVAAEGRRIVFLLRLSPVVPFNVLNYALGITRVRFTDYLVASLGMLPGAALYVYYGKLAGDVAALAGDVPRETGFASDVVLALGLAATAAATLVLARVARRALHRARIDCEGSRTSE